MLNKLVSRKRRKQIDFADWKKEENWCREKYEK